MREAVGNISTLKHRVCKDEVQLEARMKETAQECVDHYGDEDKMIVFVDGIHSTIQSIVSSWSESQSLKEITFRKLMLKAIYDGVAYRARTEDTCVVRTVKAEKSWSGQFMSASTDQRPVYLR